jgi:hypothetical protein
MEIGDIDTEYYKTVWKTQNDSEILKSELKDLINDCLRAKEAPGSKVPCGDGLFGVTVKKEKTPSGWMQPYVSLKVNNVEFKRVYHTGESAIRCAMRMEKILNLTKTK